MRGGVLHPDEPALLAALAADPNDGLLWQALADAREEAGDPGGELLRLHLRVRAGWDDPEREAWQERMGELLLTGVGYRLPRLTNLFGMELALVPPGRFLMGSPLTEEWRRPNEHPHPVELTRAFWAGAHPVTQEQYRAVTGASPSEFSAAGTRAEAVDGLDTARFPVECVSWDDAMSFCAHLGIGYRLPTEAEREHIGRGGGPPSHPFHFGKSLSTTQANFLGPPYHRKAEKVPSLGRTSAVGVYPPNGFGLNDIHGNVLEWCLDWYEDDYYTRSPPRDPPGPATGDSRSARGGSWVSVDESCRCAYRHCSLPTTRGGGLGFRVVLAPG